MFSYPKNSVSKVISDSASPQPASPPGSKLIKVGAKGDEGRLLAKMAELASQTADPDTGKQPTPMQAESLVSVDALIEEAEEIAPAFHEFLKELVRTRGGDYLQGPNKTRERAVRRQPKRNRSTGSRRWTPITSVINRVNPPWGWT